MSKLNELFKSEIHVVNLGIEAFYEDLKEQEIKVIQVDWRPRAGGDKELAGLLDLLM